jgi:hypothetical protein
MIFISFCLYKRMTVFRFSGDKITAENCKSQVPGEAAGSGYDVVVIVRFLLRAFYLLLHQFEENGI